MFIRNAAPFEELAERWAYWTLRSCAQRATPLFNKKSALALLHSDTGTAAILRNELNAGFLQGPLNSVSNIVGHGGTLSVIPFETLDRRQRALRRFRQLRLGPAQQPAGSSNLFDRNHQKGLDPFWIIRYDPFSIIIERDGHPGGRRSHDQN